MWPVSIGPNGASVPFLPLALFGIVIGIIAGMFGIGGGFLLTPTLIFSFGVPPTVAVGSALSQKCGTSILSFLKFRKYGLGEPRFDLLMMGGSIMGVDLGTRILAYLHGLHRITLWTGHKAYADQVALDLLFFFGLLYVGAAIMSEALKSLKSEVIRGDVTIPGPLSRIKIPPYVDLPGVGLSQVSLPVLVYLALLLGVLSAVMGIGGGVIFTPILMYGYGLSARHAAGTGLILLFVTVAMATFEGALHGFVSLNLSLAILAGSSFGTLIGAGITKRIKNRYVRLIFGSLVLATVAMTAWDFYSIAYR